MDSDAVSRFRQESPVHSGTLISGRQTWRGEPWTWLTLSRECRGHCQGDSKKCRRERKRQVKRWVILFIHIFYFPGQPKTRRSEGSQARSKALDSGSSLAGVLGFKSHPSHAFPLLKMNFIRASPSLSWNTQGRDLPESQEPPLQAAEAISWGPGLEVVKARR